MNHLDWKIEFWFLDFEMEAECRSGLTGWSRKPRDPQGSLGFESLLRRVETETAFSTGSNLSESNDS